jgi:hypothetical protein
MNITLNINPRVLAGFVLLAILVWLSRLTVTPPDRNVTPAPDGKAEPDNIVVFLPRVDKGDAQIALASILRNKPAYPENLSREIEVSAK